ncbi:prepilin-type cleavage/methylation N-terminal domain protein [Streptococcus downei F0415]|uniref:competence type IV pilus minor pilin ComGD n=1 Tax=Streptococcus downei TaxID=1317 RepID=UPI0001E9A041|nr:competence type IV pilus minor pilin ComGD [Streptococcus downei]EFQ56426.1 prepilin-type cleavage/methylation N-terminal domain protein [Streptococcus downei F0415]
MIITRNIRKVATFRTRAFTLLESLLVLAITSFLLLAFTGSVQQTFRGVQEKLFFLSFEHLYQDSQKLSNAQQKPLTLKVSDGQVTNGQESLTIPDTVKPSQSYSIEFSSAGGNSSLEKLTFSTKEGSVSYQLYIGSGRYKKTEN